MSLLNKLRQLLDEPPPAMAFEITPHGVSVARTHGAPAVAFEDLPPSTVTVMPTGNNVQQPEALESVVRKHGAGVTNRRTTLILPDYAARIAVLDFDALPAEPEQRLALVRHRLRRTVPFDIDSAAVSAHVQPTGEGRKMEVVAAAVSAEVLAPYEAPFRAQGLHTGLITVSSLAALDLLPATGGVSMMVKLSGAALTVALVQGTRLRLLRCLELPEANEAEIAIVVDPMVAYAEDQLGDRPERVYTCGLGQLQPALAAGWQFQFNLPCEPLRSRLGTPNQYNAGLFGYLESLQ